MKWLNQKRESSMNLTSTNTTISICKLKRNTRRRFKLMPPFKVKVQTVSSIVLSLKLWIATKGFSLNRVDLQIKIEPKRGCDSFDLALVFVIVWLKICLEFYLVEFFIEILLFWRIFKNFIDIKYWDFYTACFCHSRKNICICS